MTPVWFSYILLGTWVPGGLFLVATRARSRAWTLALVVTAFVFAAFLLRPSFHPLLLGLALLQTALGAWVRPSLRSRTDALLHFLTAWLAWEIFSRLIWWTSFDSFFFAKRDGILLFAAIFAAAATLTHAASHARSAQKHTFLGMMAAAILAVFSFKVPDAMFSLNHHWGSIAGPAELVRQGHVLYWDVPAQYGFLSTLALAAFPGQTPWHSLYAISAGFLFSASLLLLGVLREVSSSKGWHILVLLATVGAVFVLPGSAPEGVGPYPYPSASFFRFFWVFALTCLWVLRARETPWKFADARWVLIGSFVWLLGSLWSAESAFYCACAWLLPHLIAERRQLMRALLPFALLGGVLGITLVAYLLKLGHLPDLWGFVEYGLSFAGGFAPEPLELSGVAATLAMVYLALACALYQSWKENPASPRSFGLLSLAGAFWAVSSYFVARSNPNNATNLLPFMLLACAGIASLSSTHRSALPGALLVPLITMMAFCSLKGQLLFKQLKAAPTALTRPLSTLLPTADSNVRQMLAQASTVKPVPWVLLSQGGGLFVPNPEQADGWREGTAWLPILPYVLMNPLPQERRATYLKRFQSASQHDEGCLLRDSELPAAQTVWVSEYLLSQGWMVTQQLTRGTGKDEWRLLCFKKDKRD